MITLMKRLIFCEEERDNIVLSHLDSNGVATKIRLDPATNSLTLKATTNSFGASVYPLDTNLSAISPTTHPHALRQWVGFEVEIVEAKVDGDIVGSARYRLYDGTSQWFYNGTAWVVASGVNDWNSEAEVASNISLYTATTTKILGVVVNLITTNPTVTPRVYGIKLAYRADLPSQQDDLIYRSLIPAMKAGIRPTTELAYQTAGATTIDLGALMEVAEVQHNVTGVEAVFNHTDDPDHNVNLYSAYNPATKIITITAGQTANDMLVIRAVYEPYVVFEATDQDYTPVEKIPVIILSSLRSDGSTQASIQDEVVNKAVGTAYVFPPMMNMRYTCQLQTLTPSGTDEQRLVDAIKLFFGDNAIIRTTGTDEPFELFLADAKYTSTTTPSEGEAHTSTMSFRVQGIYFQVKRTLTSAQDNVYPITRVVTTDGVVIAVQQDRTQFVTPAAIASSAVVNSPIVDTP